MSQRGIGVILEKIPNLEFVLNLGDFSSASGLKPRVSEILAEIANLQIPPNLGDFSNIADDAARQEGRAAGVRAAGWAGTANHNGMGKCCRSAKKPAGYPAPFRPHLPPRRDPRRAAGALACVCRGAIGAGLDRSPQC